MSALPSPHTIERGARCGSTDPEHRARRCRECKRIYARRFASGESRFLGKRIPNPATCVLCDLTAGNSQRIKVLRYPLLRHIDKNGRHTSVCIGSLALCDRCIVEYATVKEQYLPARERVA